MPTAEILRAARAKIAEPGSWTRLEFARDANGRATHSTSDTAVCFCALGAVNAVAYLYSRGALRRLLEAAVPPGFESRVGTYNDHPDTTHADVLALYDRAIEKAERKIGG